MADRMMIGSEHKLREDVDVLTPEKTPAITPAGRVSYGYDLRRVIGNQAMVVREQGTGNISPSGVHDVQKSDGQQPGFVPPKYQVKEEALTNGKVRIRVWGKIGDPIDRPGLEKKYPSPTALGLKDFDRWHLAGPDATGLEEGIVYAPTRFNISETARIENIIRRARSAIRENGGDLFFDFTAECQVAGDFEGVQIRMLESVHWELDARVAGSNKIINILNETYSLPPVPGLKLPPSASSGTNSGLQEFEKSADNTETLSAVMEKHQATTKALEGAGQMIYDKQLQIIQENIKVMADKVFNAKYRQTVQELNARGEWVVVKMIMDAPKAPNILQLIFMEPSDIEHFITFTLQHGPTRELAINPSAPGPTIGAAPSNQPYQPIPEPSGQNRMLVERRYGTFPPTNNSILAPGVTSGMSSSQNLTVMTGRFVDRQSDALLELDWQQEKVQIQIFNRRDGEEYLIQRVEPDTTTQSVEVQFSRPSTQEQFISRFFLLDHKLVESRRKGSASAKESPETIDWQKQ